MEAPAIFQVRPEGYSLKEAKVRLARPEERVRWDQTVDQHHYLGFKRFAGRGLRYIVEWRGQWLALAGWQSGAFKEPASGPLGRLEAGVALPAAAPDREQHPVCDLESAGGFSSSRLLGAGRDDAASESGLAGSLRTPVADRGELRRPGPLPGDPLPSGELALSGQHPGVCAAQRPLHRPARQAEAALCLPAAAQRTAASARPAPAATSLGAEGT